MATQLCFLTELIWFWESYAIANGSSKIDQRTKMADMHQSPKVKKYDYGNFTIIEILN